MLNYEITIYLNLWISLVFSKIIQYIGTATKSLDVCVYFLTCNSIVKAIIDLQKKNVFVRVITDDESSGNEASQVLNMRKAGMFISLMFI